MREAFDIPVLMLVFNRPEQTQQVFNALKLVKPSKLYIAADGPRASKPNDKALSDKTRAIFEQVDWPCVIKTLYRGQNMGCGPAVSGAISWFFEQEEMGIILEDDCVPNASFFKFCEELLFKYKNNEQVMCIAGSNFQQGNKRGEGSYYFSMFTHVWGWASWRRAWKHYDYNLNSIANERALNLDYYTQNRGLKRHWRHIFLFSKKQFFNTWDYQWGLTVLAQKGLSIVPNINMVDNIGNVDDSTHFSGKDDTWIFNRKTEELESIVHTNKIELNREADEFFYQNALNPRNTLTQKLVKTLRYLRAKVG